MLIHCTKKLLDTLKIKAETADIDAINPLFSWRANILTIDRRKTLVMMCDATRYVVAIYGLRSKDFKQLDGKIIDAIKNTLLKEQVNPEVIIKYLSAAGSIKYVKNSGRSETAKLNKACDELYFNLSKIESDYCDTIGTYISSYFVGHMENDRFMPSRKMVDELNCLGISPILKCRGFELTVKLALANYDAVRKLVVPHNITFLELHKVLQKAFDWHNYHLFDFIVYDNMNFSGKPIAELVSSDEDLTYRDNAIKMNNIILSEYLPKYKYICYTYDYGDDWKHYIELTNVYYCSETKMPVLVSGGGNAPPENVGGISGYESFCEIMSSPDSPEYEDLKKWAESQWYHEFDFDKIVRQVNLSLTW